VTLFEILFPIILARFYPFGDRAMPAGGFRHYIWGGFLQVGRKWCHVKAFSDRESMTYARQLFCHREMEKVELMVCRTERVSKTKKSRGLSIKRTFLATKLLPGSVVAVCTPER
jgi:hypothetical protein